MAYNNVSIGAFGTPQLRDVEEVDGGLGDATAVDRKAYAQDNYYDLGEESTDSRPLPAVDVTAEQVAALSTDDSVAAAAVGCEVSPTPSPRSPSSLSSSSPSSSSSPPPVPLRINSEHVYVDLLSCESPELSTEQVIERHLPALLDNGYTNETLQELYVVPNAARASVRKAAKGQAGKRNALRIPFDVLVRARRPEWFLGDLDRETAQQRLISRVPGSFVVRKSTKADHYAITVRCQTAENGNPVFWNGLVAPLPLRDSGETGYIIHNSNVMAPTVDEIILRCICSHSIAKSAGIPTPLVLPGNLKPPKLQVKKVSQSRNKLRKGFEGARRPVTLPLASSSRESATAVEKRKTAGKPDEEDFFAEFLDIRQDNAGSPNDDGVVTAQQMRPAPEQAPLNAFDVMVVQQHEPVSVEPIFDEVEAPCNAPDFLDDTTTVPQRRLPLCKDSDNADSSGSKTSSSLSPTNTLPLVPEPGPLSSVPQNRAAGTLGQAGVETTITSLVVRHFRVPLAETLVDALHGDHTHFELVTVQLRAADGVTGTGYTYTGGTGGRAIAALIDTDLRSTVMGADSSRLGALYALLEQRCHYVGRGGLLSFAISAIDIAAWDLHLKRTGQPLWRAAGGRSARCRVYRGGIDLAYSQERLLASVRAYLAAGHNAVKIKVGRPDDIARCRAVRELLGPDRAFMIDANMSLSRAEASSLARALEPLNVLWFEEPTTPGAYADYTRIRSEGGIALAQGENLHTLEEFRHALVADACDYVQPDASNCGGITGFLRVAGLAAAFGRKVCSHGAQEIHISLVAGVETGAWVEVHSFPIDAYTHAGPVRVAGGFAHVPDTPGTGVEFNWQRLAPHEVAPQIQNNNNFTGGHHQHPDSSQA